MITGHKISTWIEYYRGRCCIAVVTAVPFGSPLCFFFGTQRSLFNIEITGRMWLWFCFSSLENSTTIQLPNWHVVNECFGFHLVFRCYFHVYLFRKKNRDGCKSTAARHMYIVVIRRQHIRVFVDTYHFLCLYMYSRICLIITAHGFLEFRLCSHDFRSKQLKLTIESTSHLNGSLSAPWTTIECSRCRIVSSSFFQPFVLVWFCFVFSLKKEILF